MENKQKKKKQEITKKVKQLKVQFLVPVFKYYNPIKYIYFMDMIFPLDIENSGEDDYIAGKKNMVRMVHIRPHIFFDKRKGEVSVTYESPTVHILHNQCDYFVEYLQSKGNFDWKQLADLLANWKSLWVHGDYSTFNGRVDIREEIDMSSPISDSESSCSSSLPLPLTSSTFTHLYYFQRVTTHSPSAPYSATSNRFSLHYSLALLSELSLSPQSFFNQILSYSLPVLIEPCSTLGYRLSLLSLIFGDAAERLADDIVFASKSAKIKLRRPQVRVDRTVAVPHTGAVVAVRVAFGIAQGENIEILQKTDIQGQNRSNNNELEEGEDEGRKFFERNVRKLMEGEDNSKGKQ